LITNAIARRYAKALVQLAAEEQRVEPIHGELTRIETLLTAHNTLSSVLINPAYGITEKRGIMQEIMVKINVTGTVANFLLLLLDRGRIGFCRRSSHLTAPMPTRYQVSSGRPSTRPSPWRPIRFRG
jgi:F-type H+-transporting ATPase subunit delta